MEDCVDVDAGVAFEHLRASQEPGTPQEISINGGFADILTASF